MSDSNKINILNIIAEVTEGYRIPTRDVHGIATIAVHRVLHPHWSEWNQPYIEDGDLSDTIIGAHVVRTARWVASQPEVGRPAYTFLVDPVSGAWWQCLRLQDRGAHAARWNRRAFGVGAIGDFRGSSPTAAQYESLVRGLALLARAFGADVRGHDELPGGSRDTGKECPGALLDMKRLRADVADATMDAACRELLDGGVTW